MTAPRSPISFFSSSSLVLFHPRRCRSHLPSVYCCNSPFVNITSRSFSSSANTNGSARGNGSTLDYLRTWVGGHQPQQQQQQQQKATPIRNSTINNNSTTTKQNNNRPLLLTGSSYLIPTLRLERYDTPESVHHRIDYAFTRGGVGSVRSMLGAGQQRKKGWVVPIVLDLSSFQPDGSPHYKPPPYGFLFGFVEMLKKFHICVVGVANPPSVSTMVRTPALNSEKIKNVGDEEDKNVIMSMEREAMVLGLPSIMPRGRAASGASGGMVKVEDVIQLVLTRMEEENDEDTVEWAQIQNDLYNNTHKDDDNDDREENEKENASLFSSSESGSITPKNDEPPPSTSDSPSSDNDSNDQSGQTSPMSPNSPISTTLSPSSQGPPESTLYHGSVRSGQQITSKPNQSLIILGSVNSGGEVLSDGDIYVFGKLRGRALAGLAFEEEDGEDEHDIKQKKFSQARIFATNFDPELVCIGSTFTTVDDVTDLGLVGGGGEGGAIGKGHDREESPLSVMVSLDDNGELYFEQILL